MLPRHDIVSLAQRPDLLEAHQTVGGAAWPEFMLHDPVAIAHWETMMRYFAAYQLSLVSDDGIMAVINAVPLRFDDPWHDLPDRGVDWGVEKAIDDHRAGIPPNALMGIQIVIDGAYRKRRLSTTCTLEMIRLARARGIESVILPVRPADKHRFPLIPMDRYIGWSDEAGLPFDGWLRVHARLGGRTIGVCPQSMSIPGTIAEWTRWTGMTFPGSGEYIVPGALNPIRIDTEKGTGLYEEPNVWIVHDAL